MEEPKPKLRNDAFFAQSIICKDTHSISRFSLGAFKCLVNELLRVKIAAALANHQGQCIAHAYAERIVTSAKNLQNNITTEHFMVDALQGGGGFAINGNINEAIRAEDARFYPNPVEIKVINMSQSSSDVCATALRLGLHELARSIHDALTDLVQLLKKFVQDYGHIKTLARTCWQDALSITFADRFNGIADSFSSCADELKQHSEQLLKIPLGTTVLGTGVGASLNYQKAVILHLSTITGKKLNPQKNSVASAQNFPDIARVGNAIKILSETLIRFGLDLRLLNSGPRGGLGEIRLPRVVQSSSFFPDKFNPTIPETAIQGALFAHGLASMCDVYRMIPEIDLNVFEWAAGFKLYVGMETLAASIRCLNHYALSRITVNENRCDELVRWARDN